MADAVQQQPELEDDDEDEVAEAPEAVAEVAEQSLSESEPIATEPESEPAAPKPEVPVAAAESDDAAPKLGSAFKRLLWGAGKRD